MNLLIFLGIVVAIYFATQKHSVTGVEGFMSTGAGIGIYIGSIVLVAVIGLLGFAYMVYTEEAKTTANRDAALNNRESKRRNSESTRQAADLRLLAAQQAKIRAEQEGGVSASRKKKSNK